MKRILKLHSRSSDSLAARTGFVRCSCSCHLYHAQLYKPKNMYTSFGNAKALIYNICHRHKQCCPRVWHCIYRTKSKQTGPLHAIISAVKDLCPELIPVPPTVLNCLPWQTEADISTQIKSNFVTCKQQCHYVTCNSKHWVASSSNDKSILVHSLYCNDTPCVCTQCYHCIKYKQADNILVSDSFIFLQFSSLYYWFTLIISSLFSVS